ncbi:MAG TPA: VOC family protein [Ignavibacteriaceae bacterium]|nr:VOC family protein [Ignavibacteriaceae bacterium]
MENKDLNLRTIGGVFIYCNDPLKLSGWYSKIFGLKFDCYNPGKCYGLEFIHKESKKPEIRSATVYSFMKSKRKLPANRKEFMINYMVKDLDKLLKKLKRMKIKIEKTEDYEYGKFAWVNDPEGNKLELYQPTKVF